MRPEYLREKPDEAEEMWRENMRNRRNVICEALAVLRERVLDEG